jgi:hypothetical protein
LTKYIDLSHHFNVGSSLTIMKTLKLAILAVFVPFVPLAWAQTISNPSFESNNFAFPPGYVIGNGPITGWSAVGNVGLNPAGGNSSFADNGATPQGVNVAFIQGTGSLSNSVTGLIVGLNYQVTCRANSSIAGGGISNPGWSVNGGAEVPFLPPPAPVGGLNPYSTYSASFIATSDTAPLIIRNHGGGSGALLLDDFTVAVAPSPPTVATLPASRMTNTVATLNGIVNPNATNTFAWFEWGTASFSYAQQTAPVAVGSGVVPLAFSNNVTGLTPGNIYHARVVGSNALGVVRGKDVIFGSPAIALNGANPYTNECHFAFPDLASASASPLAVAGGSLHSLALKSDGMVVAWGHNGDGETNVPPGLSNVVAVAAGVYHSLALKSDGTVVAWGDNFYGQTTVPVGLSSIPFTVSGSVDTNSPGSYLLTYSAHNFIGGIAIVTRTVVVADTLVPVMTLLGNNPFLITNAANLPFVDPGATAVDLCGGNLSVVVSNPVNVKFPGTYAITYRATDASGNIAMTNRLVYVFLPPAPGDQNGDGLVSQSELDAAYATYVTNSPWLYMTNVAGLGGTNVTFALSNSVLGSYTVQYSTDLVNWQSLGPALPRYLFTDTNTPAVPQRYYRLQFP